MVKKILRSIGFLLVMGAPAITFATTFTANPTSDDSIYTSQSTWAAAHGDTSGNTRGGTESYGQVTNASDFTLERGFINWDTSSIPDDAIIDSASITLYGGVKSGSDTNFNIGVYEGTQQDIIDATDFDQVTTTSISNTTFTLSAWTTGADNVYPLNATGMAYISLTGKTKVTLREAHFDAANVSPAGIGSNYYSWKSEENGTHEPLLTVVYHLPASSSSSSATGTGAWTGSGSLPLLHAICNHYSSASGHNSGGSGTTFTFDSCAQWDTYIEIPAMLTFQRQLSGTFYSGIVLLLRWSMMLVLIFLLARWWFRIITLYRPPHRRSLARRAGLSKLTNGFTIRRV